MPTISTTPTEPLADRRCRVTVHCDRGGTHVRVWCTAAPLGTKLRADLDKGVAQVALHPSPVLDEQSFDFTPEKGGVYVLTLDELRVNRFGGTYEGDPRGGPSETLLHSAPGVQLRVLSALTQRIGVGVDFATLRLFVSGDAIASTTVQAHGEITPVLELAPSATPRARTAAEWESTKSAVTRLTQFTVSDAIGDMADFIGKMVDRFDQHRVQNGVHSEDDTDNVVGEAFEDPRTLAVQVKALSRLRTALRNHMSNTNPAAAENPGQPGSASYHTKVDFRRTLLSGAEPSESDPTTIFAAAADTYRVMVEHFRDDDGQVHENGTSMSGITTPPIAFLFLNFVTQLAALSPEPPATMHSGAALLIANGFKEI